MGICLTSRLLPKVAIKHNITFFRKTPKQIGLDIKTRNLTVTKIIIEIDYLPMLSLLFGLLDNRHTAMIRMD